MAQLIEFPLAAGGSVLIDVSGHQAGPAMRGPRGTEVVGRAQQSFEEAIGRVRPALESVLAQMRSLAQVPDEVHVEFGLDLHAEAGAFIAAVSSTANFAVSMTWRRNPASAQPQPGTAAGVPQQTDGET